MIKFEKNGTVYSCETPEEAARLSILLDRGKDFAESAVSQMSRLAMGPSIVDEHEKAELLRFLNTIKNLPNEVDGEDLAKALGLSGVTGLGPRISGLSTKLGKYRISMSTIIHRENRPGKPSLWKINKEAINKLNIFQ